ncbi:MAG: hypothetical protein RRC07_13000 [Anaerolineae bacterium]|nr:hypothetical protein [Anaerolineae bacterium]
MPALVAHADWSVSRRKRWLALAELQPNGDYVATVPQPAGAAATLLYRLFSLVPPGRPLLAGFDFPIGLPLAYARLAGIGAFLSQLPQFGHGAWDSFYHVAEKPEEIGLRRPFYPYRPGGTSIHHLIDGLGLNSRRELYRVCELAHSRRTAAAPLFWTLGPQQVGKAAITGWRDMLAPAIRDAALPLQIWPFAGPLPALLAQEGIVVAETYPAEAAHFLGLRRGLGSKRSQSARRRHADRLLAVAWELNVLLDPDLAEQIRDGFGSDGAADDRYDAVIGLLGMIAVVRGGQPAGAPPPAVAAIEGWILGLEQKGAT